MRGDGELLIREYLTEESARVVLVIDRSPSMALFPSELPWLSKPEAVREAARVILDSATDAHCLAGVLDCCSPHAWLAPGGGSSTDELRERASQSVFEAPAHALEAAIRSLLELERGLHDGTFVFVISDFLDPPEPSMWEAMLARGWDIVPVVTQEPIWEQSFPDVAGMLLAVSDPETGLAIDVRMSEAEVVERRAANEARALALGKRLRSFGLDSVELSSAEPSEVFAAFASWAVGRREGARTVR